MAGIYELKSKRAPIDWTQVLAPAMQGVQQGIGAQNAIQAQLLPLLFKAQLEQAQQDRLLDRFIQGGNGPMGDFDISVGPGGITYKQKSPKEKLEDKLATERMGSQVPSAVPAVSTQGQVPQVIQDAMEQDFILNPNYATGGEKFIKNPKITASKEKQAVESAELGSQAQSLIDLFRTGQEEGKTNIKGFGATELGGRIAGRQASILAAMGKKELPALNIYNRKKKAFATTVAKAAGEVRPTDEDIKRFMGTLPDFNLSDQENEIVIEQLKKDITSKGYKNVWNDRKSGQGGIPEGFKMQKNRKTGETRLVPR
ncbi:MAG: hypothetical protein V1709_04330 [Planctomycetota bacterium]